MKYFIYAFIILLLFSSCSNDDNDTNQTTEDNTKNAEIWNGPMITFSKKAGADPTDDSSQDKITSSVSITRGNSGGEIFNIISEDKSSKGLSPIGTKWAVGELSDISTLTFSSFRDAVGKPKQVVGKNLVLHIEKENIYLAVKFKIWGESQSGSFTYERSTKK